MTETIAPPETHETHDAHHDDHDSPERIKREMRVYIYVLCALAVLTGVTVGVCYGFQLPIHYAVMVALAIAGLKGFLVAGFFMHLLSERKLVYGILLLTVVFFAVLLWGPAHDIADKFHY
ncbi:MAG TPA: cytochrome C oxidase subunit IV family protein [Thermoanaerobaculia bacterium]|nr:cytochrome C oxidase subunit IV family protein [Thermoanaerobaculia bacterium]